VLNDLFLAGLAAAIALSCAVSGYRIGKLRSGWWLAGVLLPLGVLLSITLVRRFPILGLHPPLEWLVRGRTEHLVLAAAVPFLLATLTPRLERRTTRRWLAILGAVFVGWECIAPFLLPITVRGTLSRIETCIDADGVCRQQTGFTCGPASAVTVLRQVGIGSTEGELAILFHSTPSRGTELELAARLLEDRFGSVGLCCERQVFASSAELPVGIPALAVVKYRLMMDHIVAATRDMAGRIIVGDPLTGRRVETVERFDEIWRGEVVLVRRVR
jgi:predicted double-glycine peptidase